MDILDCKMLFDELDIEKRLDPGYFEEHKLYCNAGGARKTCSDGSKPSFWGENCDDGQDPVWVPDYWPEGKPPGPEHTSDDAGFYKAKKQHRDREPHLQEVDEEQQAKDTKVMAAEKKARWTDQCFLTEGWEAINEKFNECSAALGTSGYQHVIPILAKSTDIVSVLANRENANLFFNLSPAQLSMLVPTIRLFIVKYKEQNIGGKMIIVEDDEPLELYLDDFTDRKLVQNIMTGATGRANAVGLESFSYEFDGKNPATTDSLIKANLNLILNNFERLTEEQDNGAKFLDLLLRTKKMVKQVRDDKVAKDTDNIYNFCKKEQSTDPSKNETDAALVFNPDYRRIKASVGWAIPPGELFFELFPSDVQRSVTPEFRKNVVNLLESLKLHLFLEMTDYDLDFRNDGKLGLSVNFRAAVEGELNRKEANIFFLLENEVKLLNDKKDKKISDAAKRRKERDKTIKPNPNQPDPTDEQKEALKESSKQYIDKKRSIENRAANLIEAEKLQWYSKFIDELQKTNRLILINLTQDALDLWKGNRPFDNPEQDPQKENGDNDGENEDETDQSEQPGISAGEILKEVFDGDGSETLYGRFQFVNDDDPNTPKGESCKSDRNAEVDRAAKALKESGEEDDSETAAKVKKNVHRRLQNKATMYEDKCAASSGTRNLYLTFMGDVLDTAMKFVNEINKEETNRESTIRLITSQITFTDPYSGRQGENRREALNIADIPVSLDEFIQWFYGKVIKPGRTSYPVMEFIRDAITHLAVRSFGYNCTGGTQFTPVLNYTYFDLPRLQDRKEPLEPGRRYNTLTPVRKAKKNIGLTLLKSPSEVVDYIVINGSARTFVNRNSNDLAQDERDGIYHFGIGLNRGILKEIKFTGTRLKYQTEARVIDQGVSGINELFRKFDATVEMYGCPIFRNGQYLFLDPRTMGVGSDIARAMGLGGYYHIYGVHGKLTRSNYVMELKCNYQGSGLCGNETIDQGIRLCGEFIPPSRDQQDLEEEIARSEVESGIQAVDLLNNAPPPTGQEAVADEDWRAGNEGPPALPEE